MSYAFWSLVNQHHQIHLAQVQAQQLAGIQGQLAHQAAMQQQQAMLAQLLFDTERVAGQLAALSRQDVFAAGVLSSIRLRDLAAFHAGMFHTVESKRSWAHAVDTMGALWRAVEYDPTTGPLARKFLGAFDYLMGIRQHVGGDPDGALSNAEGAVERAGRDASIKRKVMIGTLVGLAVIGVGGCALSLGISVAERQGANITGGGVLAGCGGTVWAIVTAVALIVTIGGHLRAGRALEAARAARDAMRGHVDALRAFMSSPDGGQFLASIATRHPLLSR